MHTSEGSRAPSRGGDRSVRGGTNRHGQGQNAQPDSPVTFSRRRCQNVRAALYRGVAPHYWESGAGPGVTAAAPRRQVDTRLHSATGGAGANTFLPRSHLRPARSGNTLCPGHLKQRDDKVRGHRGGAGRTSSLLAHPALGPAQLVVLVSVWDWYWHNLARVLRILLAAAEAGGAGSTGNHTRCHRLRATPPAPAGGAGLRGARQILCAWGTAGGRAAHLRGTRTLRCALHRPALPHTPAHPCLTRTPPGMPHEAPASRGGYTNVV